MKKFLLIFVLVLAGCSENKETVKEESKSIQLASIEFEGSCEDKYKPNKYMEKRKFDVTGKLTVYEKDKKVRIHSFVMLNQSTDLLIEGFKKMPTVEELKNKGLDGLEVLRQLDMSRFKETTTPFVYLDDLIDYQKLSTNRWRIKAIHNYSQDHSDLAGDVDATCILSVVSRDGVVPSNITEPIRVYPPIR